MSEPAPTRPVYLDCHATTPVDPRVFEAMRPWFTEKFGNASSTSHVYGWEAAAAVDRAREQVARLLQADSRSIIFTSGATESNNLALKGVLKPTPRGSRLVVSAADHRAVLDPARRLQRQGYDVGLVPVDANGRVDPHEFERALTPGTVLASIILANNEVGTINAVAELGAICRERNVWFHCDAAQAVGRIPLDLDHLPIDLLSFSGHKLYGPKGIGVLYLRRGDRRVALEPQQDGGGHEQRLRSGTLPVPLIVGLGEACELAQTLLPAEFMATSLLRDRLWTGLAEQVDGLTLNGHPSERLPGNLHVSIARVPGDVLLARLKRIAVSSGSACTSAEPEPSHVLRAMGVPEELAKSSVRFGVGRFNTPEHIELAISHVAEVVRELRR